IAAQSVAAYDSNQARMVLMQLETLASTCDPGFAAYAASPQGIRSIFRGTVAPEGDCAPLNMFDMTMAAGALASCTSGDGYACVPVLTGPWTCAAHSAMGGHCFTDINCQQDLYCNNPKLSVSGSTCLARKPPGSACMYGNECLSLSCRGGSCQPPGPEAAYCS